MLDQLAMTRGQQAPAGRRRSALAALLLLALVLLQVVVLWTTSLESFRRIWGETFGLGLVWLSFGRLFALAGTAVLIWRLLLYARYRPAPGVDDSRLPSVTVIVPAYNEGRQVYKTLQSLVQSDYPAEKLSIIAVDDGSADDTWAWIERGRAHFGERIKTIRFRANRGKREALYAAFGKARGEILVTVDSDSEVLPDTLRNLVSPLAVDERVGAVAGNVRVLNQKGAIPRMLDVSFTLAFDLMRACESEVNAVFCCPGALSAYRRSLVERFKAEWVSQTFLGSPASIGEDRAMTNFVLKMGYLVKYQSNAVVLTEVPERLPQLCRMLLRWARSDVRETLVLARFAFRRFRPEPALGARVNLVWSMLTKLLQALFFVPTLALLSTHPGALGMTLAAVLAAQVVPAAVFALARSSPRALWAFPYGLFYALCLSWIAPYGLVTPHRSSWLTRRLPAAPVPAQRAGWEPPVSIQASVPAHPRAAGG